MEIEGKMAKQLAVQRDAIAKAIFDMKRRKLVNSDNIDE